MTSIGWSQLLAVWRLEMKKSFFARRGLWVYLLALVPVVLFMGRSIQVPIEQQRLARLARGHSVTIEQLHSIRRRMTREQLVERLGKPVSIITRSRRIGDQRRLERSYYRYTDGHSDYTFVVDDDVVQNIWANEPQTLSDMSVIFATIFQYYFLRTAIFFGCVGIFMNLFRGELLDKSLHYYLLTPMRRELLVLGKYLSGLMATIVIFTISAALQFGAMLWQFDRPTIHTFLHNGGWGQLSAYLGVTVLACLGYGAIFLLAGLLFRNPIIPAAAVLVWESANLFLPLTLKKISLIFYLQSLCPVVAPPDSTLPLPIQLLISSFQPAGRAHAIAVIFIVSLALLTISAFRGRKLEINYSTD
jgi:ABC-type transport system involved in multi-copper enzyme maturation permease subunit